MKRNEKKESIETQFALHQRLVQTKNITSSFTENVLVAYFGELKKLAKHFVDPVFHAQDHFGLAK